jgi:hypothetical protein
MSHYSTIKILYKSLKYYTTAMPQKRKQNILHLRSFSSSCFIGSAPPAAPAAAASPPVDPPTAAAAPRDALDRRELNWAFDSMRAFRRFSSSFSAASYTVEKT